MPNIKLSVIIPAYHDKYNKNTVEDLLKNSELGSSLEIIVIQDGFWMPVDWIVNDPRVRYIHLGANRGMRGAINAGIAISRGEFIGRMDEHCAVGPGMDKILTDSCKPNEIMTPRRFYLDPVKWAIMPEKGYVEHEKLVIQNVSEGVRKFAGKPDKGRDEKQKDVTISEMTALQGSFWIVPRKWFKEVCGDELQTEGYGPTYNDSVELCMKTWKAGGRLVVNKNTFFAHKHRDFPRTHNNGSPENPSKGEEGWAYSLSVWEQYYQNELLPAWKGKGII